jgi:hypothetical protein
METFLASGIMIFGLIIIFSIPPAVVFLIWVIINKFCRHKKTKIKLFLRIEVIGIAVGFLLFFLLQFMQFRFSEEEFRKIYKKETNIELPQTAKIIDKKFSTNAGGYFLLHDAVYWEALIQYEEKDYFELRDSLKAYYDHGSFDDWLAHLAGEGGEIPLYPYQTAWYDEKGNFVVEDLEGEEYKKKIEEYEKTIENWKKRWEEIQSFKDYSTNPVVEYIWK